jgi:hypothetical protein
MEYSKGDLVINILLALISRLDILQVIELK